MRIASSAAGHPHRRNDVAEEAPTGDLMVQDRAFVPISTAVNPSGFEALHVLAIGALVQLLDEDEGFRQAPPRTYLREFERR